MDKNLEADDTFEAEDFLVTRGVEWLRMMLKIREFEESLPDLIEQKLIYGSTHPASGMEAIAVGVSAFLEQKDAIVSTHRGHGHCLAKGADAQLMYAELFGRQDGYCGGRGGSMHLAVRELGIMGTNGIVGAGAGIGVGAGLASDLKDDGSVVVIYFGDGAVNQGVVSESFNLAALWKLPILFVCEDNGYAQSTPTGAMYGQPDLVSRAEAFGVSGVEVDGMDVFKVATAASEIIRDIRTGSGHKFLLAKAYRYAGHNGPKDTQKYRTADEVEEWKRRDPIAKLVDALSSKGMISLETFEQMRGDILRELSKASEAATEGPMADVERALASVYAER